MPDRKFKVGDIVRCNDAGRAEGVPGREYDRLVVTNLCEGYHANGEPLIRVQPEGCTRMYGRWRERWYELVEEPGPW